MTNKTITKKLVATPGAAAAISAYMRRNGISRAALARGLKWPRQRVTNTLAGTGGRALNYSTARLIMLTLARMSQNKRLVLDLTQHVNPSAAAERAAIDEISKILKRRA